MLELHYSTQFKRDLKACSKRGLNIELLQQIVDTLAIPSPLPNKNRDHFLTGDYAGYRECHVQPDWLLIYQIEGNVLFLFRTGSHSDLFR